jgi:hypothetical protein
MPDNPTFHIGTVSGGQNNLAGNHNTFNQDNTPAPVREKAQLDALQARIDALRSRLGDFEDPRAAGQALDDIAREPSGDGAHSAVSKLVAYVKPGTEAMAALTALAVSLRDLIT